MPKAKMGDDGRVLWPIYIRPYPAADYCFADAYIRFCPTNVGVTLEMLHEVCDVVGVVRATYCTLRCIVPDAPEDGNPTLRDVAWGLTGGKPR